MSKSYTLVGFLKTNFFKQNFALLLITVFLITQSGLAQTAATGDYRSAVTTGNWNTPASWQVRDALGNWTTPSAAPTSTNNVYIQAGHTITVNVATATCNDLHLNVQGVLAVGANTVEINGKIRSYGGLQISGGILTSNVATITTPVAHPFTTGQSITIVGLSSSLAVLNGTQTIASTPTSTTFTIAKTNADIASNTASQVYPAAVLLIALSTAVTSGVDGVFYSNQTASGNGTGVVNSTMCTGTQGSGSLKFVGNSRNITVLGEWSTVFPFFPIDVNFALNAGQTGTLLTPFHGSAITISSGIVATSLRFLSSKTSSTGGDLTIKTGATLQSSVSGSTQIVCRSSSNKAGTFTIESGATLELAGISPTIAVTSIVNNGTISYSRSGTQNLLASSGDATAIAPTTYNNLTFAGTNTKTALANITVNGALTVNSGVTFAMSTFDFLGTPSSVANSGTITTSSLSTTPFTSGINWGTSGVVNYAATTGGQTVIAGNYFNLTLSNTSGTNTLASTGTIGIAGTFTPGTQAATIAGSTINYNNATGGQTVVAFNYHNLTIGNTSGTTTLASSGTIGIAGTFSPGSQSVTITGSTINYNNSIGGQTVAAFNYQNLTVSNASGTTTLASSGTIGIAGTFTPGSQAFVNMGSTINFSSASGQTIPVFSYNNITLSQTSTSSTLAGTINVAGTLTIAGSKALTVGSGSVVYGAGSTFKLNGTSSQAIVTGSLEWPATNGPTNVTVNANNLTFTASAGISRTITGTLTLDGGSLGINVSNTLVMANGSTIARMQTGSGLSFSSGTLGVGTSASDVVNVTIGATMTSAGEFGSSPSPGGWGVLTINSGTYTVTSSRTISAFVNNGIYPLGTTNTLTINGNISGSGTITGDATSNISFGGTGAGSIGTLSFTSGAQVLNNLTINRTGGTLTLGTPVALSGNLALTSGTLADGGNTISLAGYISGTGTHSGTGKITMTGASKTIAGVTVGNLEIANTSSTTTLSAAITVNGNLTLTSGTLADGGFTINLAGNLAGTATHSGSGKIVMTGTSKTIAGVTVGNLEIANTSSTTTLIATATVNGNLTLTSGTLADGGFTINLAGNLAGTATHGGTGKITMTGATKTISGVTVGNLEIANTSSTTTLSAALTVNGNLTLTSGTLADGGFTINLAGNLAGTATHSGTGKIAMSGASKSISGVSVGNLEIASSGTITASTAFAILGNLTLTSGILADGGNTITLSGNIAGSGTHTGAGKIRMIVTAKTISVVTLGNLEIACSSGVISGPVNSSTGPTINVLTITTGGFAGSSTINTSLIMNGGGYGIGTGSSATLSSADNLRPTVTFNNNATFIRNSSVGNLSAISVGKVVWGSTSSDLVNIIINASASNGVEINDAATVSPGKIGTLTIASGVTYTWTSNRTVTNLVNDGTLIVSGSSCAINGNISGTGKISSTSAGLTLGGAGTGSAGTLSFADNSILSSLTINRTGTNGSVTLGTPITLTGNLSLTAGTLNDGGNTITVGGSVSNTGTHASTGAGEIYLTGAANTISAATLGNVEIASSGTYTCASSPTITGNLVLTSGTLADNAKTITVQGNLSGTATHSGTGKILLTGTSKTLSAPNLVNLEIAGTITATTNIGIAGNLTLTSGTLTDGGNTFTIGGNLASISGSLSSTGKVLMTATAASVSVAGLTYNNLELNNNTNGFTLSGSGTVNGTLTLTAGVFTVSSSNVLTMANNSTIVRAAGSFSGTPNYGTTSTDVVNITINNTCNLGTELPSTPVNGKAGTLTIANGVNYTITGGRTITNLANSGLLILAPGTTFTLVINGAISGAGTITGHPNASINYGGTSATLNFTSGAQVANTFTVNCSGTLTLGTPVSINGTLNLTNGVLNNTSNNITLPNGGTINRVAGSITAAPVFTTSINITYNGTSAQVTGPELPTSSTLINNFSVSNSLGVTLNSSVTVNGVYSFSSGKITLGNNNLTFGSGVTYTGTPSASKYIVLNGTGTFTRKAVGNTATYFPIGTATSFAPLTITNTSGTSDLTTFVKSTFTNAPIDATKMVNLEWSVLGSAATTATVLFQYNSTDKATGYTVGVNDLGIFTNGTSYTTSAITTSGTSTIIATKTGIAIPASGNNYLVIGNSGAVESAFTTWTSTSNTSWTNPANWNNGVPTTGIDPIIAATSASPVFSGTQTVGKLTINNGATLVNNGTLNVSSNFGNDGTISGTGTLVLNGSTAQSYNGSGTVASFTLNNSNGLSITSGNKLNITGTLTLKSGTLTTNGNVVLKSNSITSSGILAPVGTSGNSGTITGNVVVERYIPNGLRSFRDIAPGVANAGSMFTNWQEGGAYTSGTGIFITGEAGSSKGFNATTGIDYTKTIDSSNWTSYYDNSNVNNYTTGRIQGTHWFYVLNTKNTNLDPYQPYRVLVRGDRSFSMFDTLHIQGTNGNLNMVNATAIRATGKLITGNVVYSTTGVSNGVYSSSTTKLNTAAAGYSAIVNPYVCPVDLSQVSATGIDGNGTSINKFYYFDPTISSTGKYVVVLNGVKNVTLSNVTGILQPGQSIFVKNTSTTPVITFTESAKVTNTTQTAVFGVNNINRMDFTLLRKLPTDNVYSLTDGAVAVFKAGYSNSYNSNEDAAKMNNANDNISIVHSNVNLSINGRALATANDSIVLKLASLATKDYQLQVNGSSFTANGLTAYLYDAYLKTTTALTNGVNKVNFTVDNAVAATYTNRFGVIFKPTAPLSVKAIYASATLKNEIATINWNTQGEEKVATYIVEKSTDAKNFNKVGEAVIAKNSNTASYSAEDKNIAAGNTYYRIKATNIDGSVQYSNIAQMKKATVEATYSLYPNPLKGKALTIQMNNVVAGKYTVIIYNALGQKVVNQIVTHEGGIANHAINIGTQLSAGVYTVSILGSEGKVGETKLSVE